MHTQVCRIFIILTTIALTHAKLPHKIEKHMDKSVEACDDFYQYACGNWIKNQNLKPYEHTVVKSQIGVYDKLVHELNTINKHEYSVLSTYWESCMNVDKMAGNNEALSHDLLSIANAGSAEELMEIAGKLSRTGTHVFYQFTSESTWSDTTTKTLHVRPIQPFDTSFTNPHGYEYDAFKIYINDLMKESGFSLTKDRSDVADIVMNIAGKFRNGENYPGELMTDLKLQWSSIFELKNIARNTFKPFATGALKHTPITDKTKVYVAHWTYRTIEKVFQKTTLIDLKIYVAFALVHGRAQWLGDRFLNVWFKFFGEKLYGQRDLPPRSTLCLESLITNMPHAIGQFYYENFFNKAHEEKAMAMFTQIKKTMKQYILKSKWMPKDVKDASEYKLGKLFALTKQTNGLKSFQFKLSHDNFLANLHTIMSHSFEDEMKAVGRVVDPKEWPVSPLYKDIAFDLTFKDIDRRELIVSPMSMDAKYDPLYNKVLLPAVMLQRRYHDVPQISHHPALDFGGFGTYVGREIFHGFDYKSFKFSPLKAFPLWDYWKKVKYLEVTIDCVEDQYKRFKLEGENGVVKDNKINAHGGQTYENIADYHGVELAWRTYRQHMMDNKLNFNGLEMGEGDQMFFLTFAQSLCTKARDETLLHPRRSPYAPNKHRVNGVVMNSAAFADAFECRKDTPMNPIRNCMSW